MDICSKKGLKNRLEYMKQSDALRLSEIQHIGSHYEQRVFYTMMFWILREHVLFLPKLYARPS